MRPIRTSLKAYAAALIAVIIMMMPFGAFAENAVDVSEWPDMGVYLVEMNTGTVLVSQNEHQKMYPGSITKVMTAIVVMDRMDPETKITVTKEALDLVGYNSSVADLEEGEVLSVKELLYASLIPSGNDAAIVLAVETGRLEAGEGASAAECLRVFIDEMNQRRAELGMSDTHFSNPDGYDDWTNYSTPYDIWLMAKAAVNYPLIKEICSMNSVSVNTGTNYHTWYTTNMLHTETYTIYGETYESRFYLPWVNGMKTGYTDMGRKCLLLSAEDDGLFVLGAILNVPSDTGTEIWERSTYMLSGIFGKYSAVSVIDDDNRSASVRITNRGIFSEKELTVWAEEDRVILVPNELMDEGIETAAVWDSSVITVKNELKGRLLGDLKAGDRAAVLEIRSKESGVLLSTVDMIVTDGYRNAGIVDYIITAVPVALLAVMYMKIKNNLKKVRRKTRHAGKSIQNT